MPGLPPGTSEYDPYFYPPDPWEGKACGECAQCALVRLRDDGRLYVCMAADPLIEIDPGEPAPECFEE